MQPILSNNDLALSGKSPNNQLLQLKQWIFEKTADCAEGTCLEVFSGTGEFSEFFLNANVPLTLSDPEENPQIKLQSESDDVRKQNSMLRIDPYRADFENSYFEHLQNFDTVFAINFLKYGPLTVKVVDNIKKLLKPGGCLITWFPAYTALFNQMDQAFNNWHRNNKVDVKKVLGRDFDIVKMRYFNIQGIGSQSQPFSQPEPPPDDGHSQTKFDELVPVFQVDSSAVNYKGISMITVAQLVF